MGEIRGRLSFGMSPNWWIALGAAAVGGAFGGGAVLLLGGKREAPPVAVQIAARELDDETSQRVGAELDDGDEESGLGVQVRSLERRVSLLTAALAARGDSGERAEGAAEGDLLGDVDVADPVFEAAVLDVMEREHARTDEERATRRKERDAERNARIVGDLGVQLGLRPDQSERLGALVSEQFAKVRALRDDESESRPVTRRQWRERMDAIAAETDARLAEVLTPQQLTAYRALDPDDQLHLGGGGRAAGRNAQASGATRAAP